MKAKIKLTGDLLGAELSDDRRLEHEPAKLVFQVQQFGPQRGVRIHHLR
jgi:hypothetical protein